MKYRTEPEGDMLRIYAVRSFANVETGDKGGLIENENNLSHDGTAWVSVDAWVFGDAQVYGDAWVSGDARVFGTAWVSGTAQIS